MTLVSRKLSNLFKRRTSEEQPAWLIFLGIASIVVYAISRTGFPKVAEVTSSIAVLAGLWGLFKYGKIVNSHILIRFLWISILIQLISWGLAQYITPEWAESSPKLNKINGWLIFIPFAWLIAQRKGAIWLMWGAAVLGILLSPWVTGGGLDEIIQGGSGHRIDFGLLNAQHTAFFFGSIFIGLCCFSKKIYQRNKLLVIPLLFIIYYLLLVLYLVQTRQAWLSIIITLILIFTYLMIMSENEKIRKNQFFLIVSFVIGFIVLSGLVLNNDRITNRIMIEKNSILAITALDFDNVPYSSFGIRFHSWVAATNFIKEKPFFGWGSNGKSLVIDHTKWLPDYIKKEFGHLHNTYFELLVNYGIAGLFFYFSIWAVIGRMLLKEIILGSVEIEFGYIYLSIFIFWGVMNFFESYQNFWTGSFFFNIFMAGIVSKVWYTKLSSRS
ncbi:O-antigen ligase family protein [Marinomonas transparens]|uniref:O-antigen ligase family protein n=1 Tax=Marinomonas transparens TaxID=2795388 RepID=A0A934N8G2_9GAMM|nr:O-antigen ligase family protein [Marinomonas transparens]MBJ7540056.1 O-antigen ligase family protein [Marinomonas transparens]